MDTVLVVDDQLAVRTALSMLFDVHGLRVEAVATPEAALARVRAGGIAVVIQDMNFTRDTTSGDEGVELFRAIREVDRKMPVVLVTAWTSLEAAVVLVKEGAHEYLQKPWDDAKLVSLVSTPRARRSGSRLLRRNHERQARARTSIARRWRRRSHAPTAMSPALPPSSVSVVRLSIAGSTASAS